MIPAFPAFKKVDISDRDAVQQHTYRYPPYSDFNFTSLWSWDVHEYTLISELNGNLIIRFSDYITGEPFYMFLGITAVNETAAALLNLSVAMKLPPVLKLIPEVVVEQLDADRFTAVNEPDHTDYILSIDKLSTYEGSELAHKRREISRFTRLHSAYRFEVLDLTEVDLDEKLKALFELWLTKKSPEAVAEEEHEFIAFRRCVESVRPENLLLTGVFVGETLGAFWLSENLQNSYAISHFEKADTHTFPGIFPYLKKKTAELLRKQGVTYINLEQDLGIVGLRTSKNSYVPAHYLKKYSVQRA